MWCRCVFMHSLNLSKFVQNCPKFGQWTSIQFFLWELTKIEYSLSWTIGQFWTILDNFISSQKWWFIFIWYPCSTMFPHYVYKIWKQMWVFLHGLFLKNDSNLLSKSKSNHSLVIYQRFYVKNEGIQQEHHLLGIEPCFPRKQQEFINQFFKNMLIPLKTTSILYVYLSPKLNEQNSHIILFKN